MTSAPRRAAGRAVVRRTVLGVSLCLILATGTALAARKQRPPRTEDIINVFLGLEYSHWLIGPIYYLATPEEREAYLALRSDEQAEAFIREFWRRRDPEPEIFGNPASDLFERRAELADRRYREQATIGRRTDRGALFILFGEPELIQFDVSNHPAEPDLEIWYYPRDVEEALGGLQPQSAYFFAEIEGRTVSYVPRPSRRRNIPEIDQ
jgi:GWxTD domain-containing protein